MRVSVVSPCAQPVSSALITAPDASRLYSHPQLLALLCPAVMIGVAGLWVIGGRREINKDPVLLVMRDRFRLVLVLCGAIIAFLAT